MARRFPQATCVGIDKATNRIQSVYLSLGQIVVLTSWSRYVVPNHLI